MADVSGDPVSPMKESRPELTISAASINSEPVELDGTPTSPERLRRESRATALEEMSPGDREVSLTPSYSQSLPNNESEASPAPQGAEE